MKTRLGMVIGMIGAVLLTPTARADETALQRRVEELESQQRQMLRELKAMRAELQAERKHTAAPAPPVVPAQAAPMPPAASTPGTETSRVAEVERKQDIMTDELRKIRDFLVLPETQELKGQYGLGPAASKVYGIPRGLSIGGYGETNLKVITQHKNNEDNIFDFVRLVAYLGYKFNDQLVLNSEIEFEHATTESTVSAESGAVSVEFATLDYLYDRALNLRGGLMLVPVGFINQVHEPPFYLGNTRPPVETQLIPTTWNATGVGIFGEPLDGLAYKAYGITSLNAKGYQTLNLRDARQSGNEAIANDWSFVGNLDYAALPTWSVAGSLYLGNQGQGQEYGNPDIGFRKAGVFTQLYEVHSQVLTQGLELRALGTTVLIDDAGLLSQDQFIQSQTDGQPIGKVLLGAYAEAAYDIMPFLLPQTTQYLAPWFRYSWLDTNNKVAAGFTPDRAARRWFYEFGLQYKPIPQVVLKVDYHIQQAEQGELPDEIRLGGGFVF